MEGPVSPSQARARCPPHPSPMKRYLERSLEPVLKRAASEFPAVVLTGPRQSGKTTLLKHIFGAEYSYVSLDLPDVRAAALEDPRSFLAYFSPPVILDEVQFATDLLPYIRERIDARRDRPGQFLLSGSQNLLLLESVTETLAGRTAILRLLPMSRREAFSELHAPLAWEADSGTGIMRNVGPRDLWREFLRGGYPELVANPRRNIHLWHSGTSRPIWNGMSAASGRSETSRSFRVSCGRSRPVRASF